jgi:hypothetical protein
VTGRLEAFVCRRPDARQDYVDQSGNTNSCTKYDVIWPVVDTIMEQVEWEAEVIKWMGKAYSAEKCNKVAWMSKPCLVFGKKSTNVFFAFTEICRKLC